MRFMKALVEDIAATRKSSSLNALRFIWTFFEHTHFKMNKNWLYSHIKEVSARNFSKFKCHFIALYNVLN